MEVVFVEIYAVIYCFGFIFVNYTFLKLKRIRNDMKHFLVYQISFVNFHKYSFSRLNIVSKIITTVTTKNNSK